MSGRRWAYIAKLVPIGVPVKIPTIKGKPSQALTVFTDTTFEIERKNPTRTKVCVNHDREIVVGELHRVYPEDNWWRVAFVLDREIIEEIPVGQPVSSGITENKWGSLFLDEVSVVKRGAVRGAEVIERLDLGPVKKPAPPPAAPVPSPSPQARVTTPRRVESTGEIIIHHDPELIRRSERAKALLDDAELRRRLDYVAARGLRVDFETVLRNLQREINGGPSISEVYGEWITRAA